MPSPVASALMIALIEQVKQARKLPPPAVARAIRATADVTQQQVAEELGINRVTVARWELGERKPRGELRLRYAALLIALERILSQEGDPDG